MDGKTILVVDDDSSMRRLFTYLLEKAGFEVSSAEDGIEGFQKVQSEKPSVVITDLMMANRNGLELCQDIRSRHELDYVSIIVITARDQSSDTEALLAAGVNRVMKKPFNPQELIKAVQELTAEQ